MEEVPEDQEELGDYCYQLYQHKVSQFMMKHKVSL